MKICKADGCKSNCFGDGYCSYHQYIRRMRGGDLYNPKPPKVKSIKKESKKRKITAPIYREIRKRMWESAVNNDDNRCFFSGEKMSKSEDFHHLKGRDGYLFIEEKWLVLAKRKYHDMYHSMSVEQLLKEHWYLGFLARLKSKSIDLYNLELKKQEKSLKLNPKLFGDDE